MTTIDLGHTEHRLEASLTEAQSAEAIDDDLARIADAARAAVAQAGLLPAQVDALYFTGGSTGLRLLTDRIRAAFPAAEVARGDRFASVATGLGLHAQRCFAR